MTLYRCIVADPPWEEKGGGRIVRGAQRHYDLMTVQQICDIPVQNVADPSGCHLYLWVTNGFLPQGLRVMKAWGFRYVTTITWAKDRFGLGQYFRGQTEQCLFGVMGKLAYRRLNGKRAQGRTLIVAPRTKHSRKPEELQTMAELVSYEPRLELFSRRPREGWDAWGTEAKDPITL